MFILIQKCCHLSIVFGSSRPVGSCFLLKASLRHLQISFWCVRLPFNFPQRPKPILLSVNPWNNSISSSRTRGNTIFGHLGCICKHNIIVCQMSESLGRLDHHNPQSPHITGEYFTKERILYQGPHHFLPTKFWGKFWQKHQFLCKIVLKMTWSGKIGRI